MTNKLYNAIQTNDTFTENGMPAHSTSGKYVLDMFFKMGGARSWSDDQIEQMFENALYENPVLAIKALFYNRDIRGGQGERRSFRVMFNWLCKHMPVVAKKVFTLVPEYGRWDDLLFTALDSDFQEEVAGYIYNAITDGNVLAKKWMPREGKKNEDIAFKLMDLFGLDANGYRNLIALDDEVVENFMCSNKWSEINYNHVPSVASKNYRSAFGKHDGERYGEWLAKLEKGDKSVKINAGAIFPHDIVHQYLNNKIRNNTPDRTLEAQWKALPDFVKEGFSFIPVVDTSASMHGDIAWEVAFALGVYLAERNKSVFKDAYITFSRIARLMPLTGNSLLSKVRVFLDKQIVEDTNIESVYDLILTKAKAARLSQDDMPTHILILSDMQFNMGGGNLRHSNAQEMIRRKYNDAGYEVPQVIYWNLRSSEGTPVKFDTSGTCLVSGFSPSLMQSLLAGDLTPENMMLAVLNGKRYQAVEDALNA